jgi:hydroxylamine reductase
MFCFQCEQTSKGTGCNDFSVCGKTDETAVLQDLLTHATKAVAQYSHAARSLGAHDAAVDHFILRGLFLTVTNVNFDARDIEAAIHDAASVRDAARVLYESAARKAGVEPKTFRGPATWVPRDEDRGLVKEGEAVSVLSRRVEFGSDLSGIQELLIYGIKGIAAYADHAKILGNESESVHSFLAEALAYLAEETPTVETLFGLCMRCGEANLKVMEILDAAHTRTFGHPVPTPVRVEPLKGKAILISGHDLKDLVELLKQTEGTGINVYTHGEMLPAHGYPTVEEIQAPGRKLRRGVAGSAP